jgi:hypothetical protein
MKQLIMLLVMFAFVFLLVRYMNRSLSELDTFDGPPLKQLDLEPFRTEKFDGRITSPELHDLGSPSADWKRTFYICWSTNSSTWAVRQDWMIELIFLHHPDAQLVIISSTLPESFFARYRNRGYSIRVVALTAKKMLQERWYVGPNTMRWIRRMDEFLHAKKSYFYSHFTDYLRMVLLLNSGGTYMDTDAPLLRALPSEEFVGADIADHPAKWFYTLTEYEKVTGVPWDSRPMIHRPPRALGAYLAPGVMRLAPGRPFLAAALEHFFDPDRYDPTCFNCVGPLAFTTAYRSMQPDERASIRPLPWYELYPVFYLSQRAVHAAVPTGRALAEQLVDGSLSLHLFGKLSSSMAVEQGSALDVITREIFPLEVMWDSPHPTIGVRAPAVYVHTGVKRGRFHGRDVLAVWGSDDIRLDRSLAVRAATGRVQWESAGAQRELHASGTISQINRLLATLRYSPGPALDRSAVPPHVPEGATDALTFTYTEGASITERVVPVSTFHRAVTLITKTMGRGDKVCALVRSFWQYFPGTPVIVGDDVANPLPPPCHTMTSCVEEECGGISFVPLPEDFGLSASRNQLVASAATPLVFLSDDDFELGWDSRLETLVTQIVHHGVDIAGVKIPHDIERWRVDFCGVIGVRGTDLELRAGTLGAVGSCSRVEFVPNVFLALRASLVAVGWDPALKLGEHEDFFLRAKEQALVVTSCPMVNVYHRQDDWNGGGDEYSQRRRRIWDYFGMALRKHGARRLISFGTVMHELRD